MVVQHRNRQIVRRKRGQGPRLIAAKMPTRRREQALFRSLLTGVDGTDEEVARKKQVEAPTNKNAIVLGHEALAEVIEAPNGPGRLRRGDHVVPLVRQGCGSCKECRAGALDLCPSDDYQEHGIRKLDGFMQDVWADDPAHVVPVAKTLGAWAVLVEPMSIAVKALQQAGRIQSRLPWFEGFSESRALVVGSGSLASMAGLLLTHHQISASVLDRHGPAAASTRLWRSLQVQHIDSRRHPMRDAGESEKFDLVIETTGVPKVILQAAHALAPNGVLVLLGIPSDPKVRASVPSSLLRRFVLRNQAMVGSVNSNRGHFEEAIRVLSATRRRDRSLFDMVVTHRFRPEDAKAAFEKSDESVVKKVIEWKIDGE